MAYDEGLAHRVREALAERTDLTEKKMFGGLCFLLGGNMCCGIVGHELMLRVGPAARDEALARRRSDLAAQAGVPIRAKSDPAGSWNASRPKSGSTAMRWSKMSA
jgi:hypothetical protein